MHRVCEEPLSHAGRFVFCIFLIALLSAGQRVSHVTQKSKIKSRWPYGA